MAVRFSKLHLSWSSTLCNMSLHNIWLKVAGFITSTIVIIIDISTFLFYQYATPIDRMYQGYLANRVLRYQLVKYMNAYGWLTVSQSWYFQYMTDFSSGERLVYYSNVCEECTNKSADDIAKELWMSLRRISTILAYLNMMNSNIKKKLKALVQLLLFEHNQFWRLC